MRIVVLGGGFGGVTTVRHLERVLRRRTDVEITLVSRDNFFVLTPLLFEACSGRLELRHCAQPIRAALKRARFIEATVESVEVEQQIVRAVAPEGGAYNLPFDHLVVALGASTNDRLIPGSLNALTFKTMADALVLRNHLIGCFERADAAADAAKRHGCLTVVVIGGGLVGVELVGELTAFADDVLRFYPRLRRDEVRFRLFEAGPRILPEIDADTIVLAAGIVPSAVASAIPVVRDQRGRIAVDVTMRSRSHRQVWALGDCAEIPGPDGRPYPALAQHAVREARHLAHNLRAPSTDRTLRGSCSARSARWRRSGIRAQWRKCSVCDSRDFSPGGCGEPTTFFRCRAGTGACAFSWTGALHSSSGRTSRGLTCAWNESR